MNSSVSSQRTFEFFASEPVPSHTPGSGELLKSDRITAVEEAVPWLHGGTHGREARSGQAGFTAGDTFFVGTKDGMVHCLRVDRESGREGYSVIGSFVVIEIERASASMGTREVFRIGHISRMQSGGTLWPSNTSEMKPESLELDAISKSPKTPKRTITGRPDSTSHSRLVSPAQQSSAIGRRLYAVLEDAVGKKTGEAANELLIVVGYSRSNIVVTVWDLTGGLADGLRTSAEKPALYPRQVAYKSVFKALKLLDTDIESVAVDTVEWPKVYVAVGTGSGAIHVYSCANVGIDGTGGGNAEFAPMRTVNKLKEISSKAGPKTNRVQFVSFLRASGIAPRSLHVWGVSDAGDVIGFNPRVDIGTSSSTQGVELMVLDKVPSAVRKGCVSMDESGVLFIATRDCILCYTMQEGRTVATTSGEKQMVVAAKEEYLVLVSDEATTGGQGQRPSAPIGPMRRVTVQIMHMGQKLIVWNSSLPGPIKVAGGLPGMGASAPRDSVSDRVTLYIIDGTGTVHRVSELKFQIQIDQLCKADMFSQALSLCEREQKRYTGLMDIDDCKALSARVNLLYGDYLFQQRQFDAAVDAYINTIGYAETSHVIQTFLQTPGEVGHLSCYLMALVRKDMATGEHVSLLLQVYVDARESKHIDDLVDQLCLRRGKLATSLDASAVIGVLRRAGFVQHALNVSEAYEQDDQYVLIMLNDRRAYGDVLDYLKTRPRAFAASQILRHGKVLIEHAREATTDMIMKLCTDPEPENVDFYVADLAAFSRMYATGPATRDFQWLCKRVIPRTLSTDTSYTSNSTSTRIIFESLLDSYLIDAQSDDCEAALSLLRLGWPPGHEPIYDPDIALIRCAIHGHHQGVAFIHTRLRRYQDALTTLAAAHHWQGVVSLCQTHGQVSDGGDPSLWKIALEAAVEISHPDMDPKRALEIGTGNVTTHHRETDDTYAHLQSLLAAIDDAVAMDPLSVLGILAKNPTLPFGMAKKYFVDVLLDDASCINATAADIALLTKKIEATKQSLDELDRKPVLFKSTRDSSTGSSLSLPAVHFLCGHSFNVFGGARNREGLGKGPDVGLIPVCPLCSENQERVHTLQGRSNASTPDEFYRQLQAAEDAFGASFQKN